MSIIILIFNMDLYKNMKPSKKRKCNSEPVESARYAGYAEKGKKNGFQPTIININSKFAERRARFNSFKQNNPHFKALLMKAVNKEPHYSTQEDTPSIIIGENVVLQWIKEQQRDEDRIYHPLWTQEHNVHSLIKLAEIKTNDFMPIPFANTSRKIGRSRQSKKVYLGGKCNQLSQNEQGELVEVELQEDAAGKQAIPEDILKSLQGLALEITGTKNKATLELLSGTESVKDKIDIDGQTCKNEDIDDLDEVQSLEC